MEKGDKRLNKLIKIGKSFTYGNFSEKDEHGYAIALVPEYTSWVTQVEDYIVSNFGIDSSPQRMFSMANINSTLGWREENFLKVQSYLLGALDSCKDITAGSEKVEVDVETKIINVLSRFHLVVKQLVDRHDNRRGLEVNDEYDVQDLLLAILKIHFDDIRKEDWVPQHAGGKSKMDLLLKEEKIVIECKKTREDLTDKEIGKQLIEDIEKYPEHPHCKKLICFVYDPESRISNPVGLKRDLEGRKREIEVKVIIVP